MRKISEILQDKRIENGYSLDNVVKAIKIKKQFIIAIEDGRYFDLPSESYALGFIKNYATYVGIDKNKAAALFRREYEGGQGKILPTFKSKDKSIKKIVIFTPRNFMIALVIFVVFGYIAFQYSSYFLGPKLEVVEPKDQMIVKNNIVEVSGKTDPYATVLINNEESYVQLDGTFKKTLYLFEGNREITIDSKNRNGKNTRKVIKVVVR
jgi:cytoskeletal protein RodZ